MPNPSSVLRPPLSIRLLICVAIPLASFLGFSVQAMVAKALVASQGGTAATWMGCTLFFQCALLGGYAGAYALLRYTLRIQMILWAVLLLIAALTLRLPPWTLDGQGIGTIFLSLTLSLAPTMLFLFGISIALQGWQLRHQVEVPYALYAASSVGSLAGLILYPFFVEPNVPLSIQFTVWRWGLGLLLVSQCVLIMLLLRNPGNSPTSKNDGQKMPLSNEREKWPRWLALSSLPCVAMLGASQILSAEIGSNPLSWVIPLGIYLASFALTFAGWWRTAFSQVAAFVCVGSWIGYSLTKGPSSDPLSGWPLLWLIISLCGACHAAHGWLYSIRPRRDFSHFYLTIAIGGACGGLFANLIAPNLLNKLTEYWWAVGILSACYCASAATRDWRARALAALPVVSVMICLGIFPKQISDKTKESHLRNTYGSISVKLSADRTILSHETTLHGIQVIVSPDSRRIPTTYYSESSAVGIVIRHLQATRPNMRIGIIGLGAGTLATYARKGDEYVFWDIDPKIDWIANNIFSFLKDSRGKCIIRMDDGRRGIAADTGDFDLVIIDAFSGDAIPPHLLTREALSIYNHKVSARGGLVLMHVSNRFADLQPVVSATAAALGLQALRVDTEVKRPDTTREILATRTRYLIIHKTAQMKEIDDLFIETDETRARLDRKLSRLTPEAFGNIWTDDQNAILDVLHLSALWNKRSDL